VRPGEVVMDLLPTSSELIVEAKLRPQDLAFIAPGQTATVKLDAYDYAIYGVLDGKVSYVSPDALSEETRAGENIYYRVQVRVEHNHLKARNGKKIEFTPGMTAQVEIATGEMSVLRYLTKPLVKTLATALTER
jgi:HlyD family type I secretion membrane fusion protein